MSLDLFVYGREAPDGQAIDQLVADLTGLRTVGDLDAAASPVVVERTMRGRSEYLANLDGPFEIEAEDLPEEVVTRALGLRAAYHVTVEASSQAGFNVAKRFARSLAGACSGVVYDPQLDAVTWPRSTQQSFKPDKTESVDVLGLSRHLRREDASDDVADALLEIRSIGILGPIPSPVEPDSRHKG